MDRTQEGEIRTEEIRKYILEANLPTLEEKSG